MPEPRVQFVITAQENVTAVMSRVDVSLRRTQGSAIGLTHTFGQSKEGMRKFENGVADLALRSVGLTGAIGRLVEGLALLGAGSVVVTALAAGIALIAVGWKLLKSDGEKLKETTRGITDQLREQVKVQRDLTLAGAQARLVTTQGALHDALAAVGRGASARNNMGPVVGAVWDRLFGSDAQRTQTIADLRQAADLAQQMVYDAGSLDRPPITIASRSEQEIAAVKRNQKILDNLYLAASNVANGPASRTSQSVTGLRGGAMPGEATSGGVPAFFTATQEAILAQIEDEFAPNLGDAVQNAFGRAFSGEGMAGLFKGFGQVILAQLGDLFSRMGKVLLTSGKIFMGLQKALFSVLTSGPAQIAAGVALIALGAGLNAIAGGGGRGGGFSAPSGFSSSGFSSGNDFQGKGSVTINIKGGPVIDLRDHETMDALVAGISEATGGRRMEVGAINRV